MSCCRTGTGRKTNIIAFIPQGDTDYVPPLELVGLAVTHYLDVTLPIHVLAPDLVRIATVKPKR